MSTNNIKYGSGHEIDIESLINEVNKCDKHLGIKVKKSNVFNEPEHIFMIALSEAELYISSLIIAINGIDPDSYIATSDTYGMTCGPIGIQSSIFVDSSDLDWRSDRMLPVNSIEFKCRFLTLFLTEFMLKLEKISLNKYKDSRDQIGPYEHAYFYLKNMLDDIKRLVIVMISGNDYGNILLKNIMNYTFVKNKVKHIKLNNMLYESITELKNDSFQLPFQESFMTDDMMIYSILRISYMLATMSTDMRVIPEFKYIENATRNDDLIKLIQSLGAAILNEYKYTKRPLPYKAFNDSSPLIMSNYEDVNEDWFTSIGIRSLCYTDFICNDKRIHKFITKMINQ